MKSIYYTEEDIDTYEIKQHMIETISERYRNIHLGYFNMVMNLKLTATYTNIYGERRNISSTHYIQNDSTTEDIADYLLELFDTTEDYSLIFDDEDMSITKSNHDHPTGIEWNIKFYLLGEDEMLKIENEANEEMIQLNYI